MTDAGSTQSQRLEALERQLGVAQRELERLDRRDRNLTVALVASVLALCIPGVQPVVFGGIMVLVILVAAVAVLVGALRLYDHWTVKREQDTAPPAASTTSSAAPPPTTAAVTPPPATAAPPGAPPSPGETPPA